MQESASQRQNVAGFYPGEYCSAGPRASEGGIAKITLLVFLPLIFVTLFAAYHIAPFYYNHFELRNQMESLIRVAGVYTDEEIRRKLETQMKALDINATVDDVRMERFGNSMRMSLQYEETFWIEWGGEYYEVHTFEFDATVERDFDA